VAFGVHEKKEMNLGPNKVPSRLLVAHRAATEHFRHTDWTATPLGDPATWPDLLNHCVSVISETPLPAFIVWGESLAFLYNAAYIPILEARDRNVLGQPISEVWPEIWHDVQPLVNAAFAGERVLRTNVMRPIRQSSRWFDLSYSPILDDAGEVAAVLCLISETTQRVELERRGAMRLAHAEQISSLTTVAAIQEASARFFGEYLDAHHVFYADVDESTGWFRIHTDWIREGGRPLAGLAAQLSEFGEGAVSCLRSGKPLVVDDVRTSPLTIENFLAYESMGIRSILSLPHLRDGILTNTVTMYRPEPYRWTATETALAVDINERIWLAIDRIVAAEKLIQADRRKDDFLAMLAHELRNPLAPIASAAELLRRSAVEDKTIAFAGSVIARQVSHMSSLLEDLLDVSRVTRGLAKLNMQPVDLRAAIEDAAEQIRPLIESRQHRFELQTPQHGPWLEGDYKRLVQVVANLLNNAAKYTPSGGLIQLSVNVEPSSVAIAVQDNGIGISQTYLPTIFEPFAQADRSADRSQGGLGLGLALVKSLVALHGGTIAVESTEGQGSRFTVTFPRFTDVRDLPVRSDAPNASNRTLEILLVDDNGDAGDTLAALLRVSGHRVDVYRLPEPAIAAARVKLYDVLLIDIGLPKISGYDVVGHVRTGGRSANSRCIAISGYGQPDDHIRARDAGFFSLLIKPVAFDTLVQLLNQA
jgi:signal transduction histidine kinase